MVNRPKPYNSKAWLEQRWIRDRKTIEEIAQEAGVSSQTIRNAMVRHGLVNK